MSYIDFISKLIPTFRAPPSLTLPFYDSWARSAMPECRCAPCERVRRGASGLRKHLRWGRA